MNQFLHFSSPSLNLRISCTELVPKLNTDILWSKTLQLSFADTTKINFIYNIAIFLCQSSILTITTYPNSEVYNLPLKEINYVLHEIIRG